MILKKRVVGTKYFNANVTVNEELGEIQMLDIVRYLKVLL